jgi:MoaA/NifB/PqqE/SkfB family radical SAM enzyme
VTGSTIKNVSVFENQFQQAIKEHQSGNLQTACNLYEQLLLQQPERVDVKHNLGAVLLGLGLLKRGLTLVSEALMSEPDNPGMAGSIKMVGMALYQSRYWEVAQSWLLQAMQQDPDDGEIKTALSRIAARDYLKPEQYDPLAKQTLKRYSPREADTYVYTIDIAGTCNLRCPTCPVGNSANGARSKKLMDTALFKQIINKIRQETPTPHPQIWLYNWGEPLLHPELPSFIKIIKEHGFSSHLSSNLNIEKGLKELIKAEPTELKISLSGFTAETYAETHRRGNLLLLKSNLYKLRKLIDQYHSSTHVWVGHHLYKNNYNQIAEVQKMCEELGFTYNNIQAFYQPLEKLIALAQGDQSIKEEPIMNNLFVHPLSQIQFWQQHQLPDYDCELRFNQTVINSDGGVALCCNQYDAENALGIAFMDYTHKQIEEKKYQQTLCGKCRSLALDYAPKNLPESLAAL